MQVENKRTYLRTETNENYFVVMIRTGSTEDMTVTSQIHEAILRDMMKIVKLKSFLQ